MSKIFLPHIARKTAPQPIIAAYIENVSANKMSYAVPGQYIALSLIHI